MSERNHESGRIDPVTKEKLTAHTYDGIGELDNPLPGWWLSTFYGAILFSAGYFVYYHLAGGPSIEETYRKEVAQVEYARAAEIAKARREAAPDFVKLLADASVLERGRKVYGTTCASCHGGGAEGGIGPNLTDRYWLHGRGSAEDIHRVIRDGVAEKGMPPWGAVLKPEELASVAVYVRSVRGTSPEGAKAPQGTEITEK